MKGLGTDIIEVTRIESAITEHGARFLDRLFTPQEQAYCNKHSDSARRFAARFAAKEAVAKALGAGFGQKLSFLDIEIRRQAEGRPEVFLSDEADARFGSPQLLVSMSHCKEYATAVVVWSN